MVRHHGKRPRKTFKCKNCKKNFQGTNLLRNHYWRGMCMVLKTYDCNQCTVTRSFKTAESRELHRQVYHSEDIPKLKCAICVKNYGAKSTMINHYNSHKTLNVLARAKRQTRAKKTRFKEQGKQAAQSEHRVGVSESAPPRPSHLY